MKEYFFPKNGIYYRTNDFEQNRETLIFIHGHAGSSSAWVKYEEKFGQTYNILTLDLRGHGKSIKPKKYRDYEVRCFVQDINDLIDFLRIERFILIGHSFGSILAVEILQTRQDKVTATIFMSPIFDVKKTPQTHIAKPFVNIFTSFFRLMPFSEKPGIHIDYSKLGYTADFDPRRVYADMQNTTAHVYVYSLKHIYAFNTDTYASRITMPALIIHGSADAIMPIKHSIEDAKKIAHCELVIVEGGNHIIPLNNFSEVSKAIEDFLAKN